MKRFFACTLLCHVLFLSINATSTIFVSPLGNDKNKGTQTAPVRTFSGAQELVRSLPADATVEVIFLDGVYYLPSTVVFTDADNKASVTYKAANEGKAVISGGSQLHVNWTFYKNGIYVAKADDVKDIDQLYINGIRQRMARFPNAEAGKNVYDKWNLDKSKHYNGKTPENRNEDPLSPERIAKWKNPAGGYIHAMHSALWGDMHWLITGKKNDTTLVYEGGWQNNRPSPMHPVFRMVENIFEELDVPGEWYFDSSKKLLYYYPENPKMLKTATVEIVHLTNLIEYRGNKQNPVKNITLDGFVFRHSARTFMDNRERLGRSDWTISRTGAVFFSGAVNCSVTNCEFDQVGGNTIFVNNFNRDIRIAGCYIHNSGASGVVFVGDTASMRSYSAGYVKQDYARLDTIPGPASDNYPSNCVVENCLITRTGRDEKQTAGVQISLAYGIRVSHCSIYDMPRAGININDGTFGGHIIEYCDVFNTVLETSDHGSFNSWGRDRYWSPDVAATANEVVKHPSIVNLDMIAPNIIRNSRWKCDYGWDIDLDDGSSNYLIYNNLLLNRGLKLREGYNRIVTNNILLNNSLHPHVWYPNSGDVFTQNIVFKPYQPAAMNRALPATAHWGKKLDDNFFAGPCEMMKKFQVNGCDSNSLCGDPLFADPLNGDFQVRGNSPVLKTGFVNFPMNQFGVSKPALKVIAKTPETGIVTIGTIESKSPVKKRYKWENALLDEPSGDELSAYGADYADGGVALIDVPQNSFAALSGLMKGDLIQMINKSKIRNIKDLSDYIKSHNTRKVTELKILRNQSVKILKIKKPLPAITIQ